MPLKNNFSIAIMKPEDIDRINQIVSKYAEITMNSSSHIYFDRQPINPSQIVQDFTFFYLNQENEDLLNETLDKMVKDLDGLNTDYILRDEISGKMIVFLNFSGELTIKFDNLKTIKKGTFKKIDELKLTENELGYCKGFIPTFRPVESRPLDSIYTKPEKIYLFSDSSENLLKLKECISQKVMEIDSELELGFMTYTKSFVEKL